MKISLRARGKQNEHEHLTVGIKNIHTSKDALPPNIPQPQKEPYLILEIPFSRDDNDPNTKKIVRSLQDYAMGTVHLLYGKEGNKALYVISGARKVKKVIEKLNTDNKDDNGATWDSGVKETINDFGKTIPAPELKAPATRGIAYEELDPVKGEPLDDSRSHTIAKIRHNSKNYHYKMNETGRQITEIETFNAMCYRLLVGEQSPRVFSVHDQSTNQRLGLISETIPGYQYLFSVSNKEKRIQFKKTAEQLADLGLGAIIGAAYAEAENDLNITNIGLNDSGDQLFVIDPGQSSFPVVSKYSVYDPQQATPRLGRTKPPANAFPITKKDINHLPKLSDMEANQFFFKQRNQPETLDKELKKLSKELKKSPKFVDDKFYTLLKRILIEDSVYKKFAELSIGSKKTQDKLIAHKIARTELLKNALLTNPQFIDYYKNNKNALKKQIVEDFEKYNKDASDNGLDDEKVNVQTITQNFDELFTPQKALSDFKTKFEKPGYLTPKEQDAAQKLYTHLQSVPLTEEVGALARRSCHLMDVYQRTCADIKASPAEKTDYVENFIAYCKGYEYQLPLSLGRQVCVHACRLGGALLGAVLGLVAGAAVGLAAGAAIGGGAGSVVPVFGNAVGAIGAGSVFGVMGAIKAAGTAAIAGTAVGGVVASTLLGYGGVKAGYLTRYGVFRGKQKEVQSFSTAFQEGIKSTNQNNLGR